MDTFTNLSIIIPNHNEKEIGYVYSYCKNSFPEAEIIIENDPNGKGKGYTVRKGVERSDREKIIFIDGDMDIHPKEITKLLKISSEIVLGKKEIYGNGYRPYITRISRYIIRNIFRLPCSDTQTGLKLFNRKCLELWNTCGFLFDVEIIKRAVDRGFKIREVLIISKTPSKRKGFITLIKCTLELIFLLFRSLFR